MVFDTKNVVFYVGLFYFFPFYDQFLVWPYILKINIIILLRKIFQIMENS